MTEQFPDITLEELNEEDNEHGLSKEELKETKEEYQGLYDGAVMGLQSGAFTELLLENKITLAQYDELTEKWFDLADERGVKLP